MTGLIDVDGRGIQLRMEDVARECPGTLEGSCEITDAMLTASYHGKRLEGRITNGRLELRAQMTNP